jgi:Short C-terminal domain
MYGRPGLVRRRPLLRAAAVGGTFAAGRAMGRRAAEQASADAYQDQRISDLEGQQNQPLPRSGDQGDQDQSLMQAAPQGTGPASAADQLGKLAELHNQGALTDEEFAAAKAKILGSS